MPVTVSVRTAERLIELERVVEEIAEKALTRASVQDEFGFADGEKPTVVRAEFTAAVRDELRDRTSEFERLLEGGR